MKTKSLNKFLKLTKAIAIVTIVCFGIKAKAQCNADFVVSPTDLAKGIGNYSNFSSTTPGSTSPYTYTWDYGDGTTKTTGFELFTIHNYTQDGTYNVCLTMTNAANTCTDTKCTTVVVSGTNGGGNNGGNGGNGGGCNAYFTGVDDGDVDVDFFDYSTTSGNNVTYTWDYGDGNSASYVGYIYETEHIYAQNGNYNVCLTITDSASSCSNTYCTTVNIWSKGGNNGGGATCDATFYGYDNGYNGEADLYAQYSSTSTYSWDFGDGTTGTDAGYASHTYAQNGTYTVCLTVADATANCSNTYCDTITIYSVGNGGGNTGCDASFYGYDNYYGGADFYTNQYSSTSTYTWDFGDGSTSNDAGFTSHYYAQNGTYNVCLTVADIAANCSNTYCDTVSIYSVGNNYSCDPTFWGYDNGFGITDFYTQATPSPTATYLWSFGDGSTSTDAGFTSHTYAQNGTYLVCLVVNDVANNCNGIYCDSVAAYSAGNTNSGCNANAEFTIVHDTVDKYNYTIYNASTNGLFYLWSFGDGEYSYDQFPTHTYSGVGPYQLCLAVIDSTSNGIICYDYHCDSILDAGRSVVTINVVPASTTTSVKENINNIQTLENYPNPFNGTTTITYIIKQNATIDLSIVDVLGNKVAVIESGNKSSGKYTTEWNAENVAPGIYMLQLKADGQISTKKLIINK